MNGVGVGALARHMAQAPGADSLTRRIDMGRLLADMRLAVWNNLAARKAGIMAAREGLACLHDTLAEEGCSGVGLAWCEAKMVDGEDGDHYFHGLGALVVERALWGIDGQVWTGLAMEEEAVRILGRTGEKRLSWFFANTAREHLMGAPADIKECVRACVLAEKSRVVAQLINEATRTIGLVQGVARL